MISPDRRASLRDLDSTDEEEFDRVEFHFSEVDGPNRRDVLGMLGAGLVVAVSAGGAAAQQGPGGRNRGGGGMMGRGATTLAARLHIGRDGTLTVMTGKVECGQGARAELTQAAAEELRVPADRVRLVMADTSLVPDDGGTFGSRSTPSTVPAIRQGCAAARELLAAFAARTWGVGLGVIAVRDGRAHDGRDANPPLSYADLAADAEAAKGLERAAPQGVNLTAVEDWTVLGTPVARPNGREIVTGSHSYPSDIARPGMLHGRVLRPPSFGAKLASIDLEPAKKIEGAVVVKDGDFVGVAAPTAFSAQKAIEAVAATAKWESSPHPSSAELFEYLRQHARGGLPANPFADEVAKASKKLRRSYDVAYVQHAPMQARAAVAEWSGDGVTVWTGSQVPFGVKGELVRAFGLPEGKVRVIVPDFGGGFGGKHPGECAVEAAKLAKGAGKPVTLRWTREEEFTWAQFRPAAAIEAEASLDDSGKIASWFFVNVNSGAQEVQSPYRVARSRGQFVASDPPLRHGSYRALAATANTFGRECFMDELAGLAGRDPLEFRLAHLDDGRLRSVLEKAAKEFAWAERSKEKKAGTGVGLACGTDKGSFVAACVEVAVEAGAIAVKTVCQAYECGKIVNPSGLMTQVQGGLIMALGPALREAMTFEGGKVRNATFGKYRVPRFEDVPELKIHLIDRPDLPSAGAGETPVIAVAPAIANAVFAATGSRARAMPIRA